MATDFSPPKNPDTPKKKIRKEDALEYHSHGPQGKDRGRPDQAAARPQRDLSLAYTPGVAEPCLEIEKDPDLAYEYTAKGNLVAVISNGTAVLGLGNIGALAGKPVMEGKGVPLQEASPTSTCSTSRSTRRTRRDHARSCRRSSRPSAASTSRTSRRRSASYIEERLKKRDEDPGLPRRPARHRHHHRRRAAQRAASSRARSIDEVQGGGLRRRRLGHRLRQVLRAARREARERHAGRHQGRGLQGPHRGHERVQGAVRAPTTERAHARRRAWRAPTCSSAARSKGAGHAARWSRSMAPRPDRLRAGQPRSRDQLPRGERGARRRHHGHRAQRLPEPGQQRPRLPVHLPRRARRARARRSTRR